MSEIEDAVVVEPTEEFFAKPVEAVPVEVAGGTGGGTEEVAPIDEAINAAMVPAAPVEPPALIGSMKLGQVLFGVTATGEPLGKAHWLADSSSCGDLVMALPSSCLIAGRTDEAGGVAVDMAMFLDAVITGAAKMEGLAGVAEMATLPQWAVSRLFGTFPALYAVYSEAMDQCVLAVEAAAFKAAIGMKVKKSRSFKKERQLIDALGKPMKNEDGTPATVTESTEEEFSAELPPDPTLSKTILTSRMKGRYKDEGRTNQAVIINISGPEANL